MAKADGGKVPKAVCRARETLGQLGLDITGGNLKKLPKDDLNKLATSFRAALADEARSGYKQLQSDAERRDWLAQYILDPEIAACRGFNSTSSFTAQSKKGSSKWLTEAQISTLLSDPSSAAILCESGDLESRPHEYPSLAAKGVKQYYYTADEDIAEAGVKDEAGVAAEADMTPKQFAEVKDHMCNNFGKAGKRKTSKPKVQESESAKRLKAVALARSSSLRKLKALSDKMHNDLAAAEKDIPKLREKGYPEQMQSFLADKVAEAKGWLKDASSVYAQEILKPDSKTGGDVNSLEEDCKRVDETTQTLDEKFQVYKKTAGSDIRKLAT